MPVRPYPYQHHTITPLMASRQRLGLAMLVNHRLGKDSNIHCQDRCHEDINVIEVIGMLLSLPKVHLVVLDNYPGTFGLEGLPSYNKKWFYLDRNHSSYQCIDENWIEVKIKQLYCVAPRLRSPTPWIPEYKNQVVEIYTVYEEANTSVNKHNNDDDSCHDCYGYDDCIGTKGGTRAELVPYCLPWKVAIGDILD